MNPYDIDRIQEQSDPPPEKKWKKVLNWFRVKPFASLHFYSEQPKAATKQGEGFVVAQSTGDLRLEQFILCGKVQVQITIRNLVPGEIWITAEDK